MVPKFIIIPKKFNISFMVPPKWSQRPKTPLKGPDFHADPCVSPAARLVVNLRVVSLVEGVSFWSSSYNFSLAENQPAGAAVGTVRAFSGSDLYSVAYALKTHADLFSVSAGGAIQSRAQLDREQQEWYILDVEAVDTRIPPTSAVAVV